jgi:Flp pilus assembly protein TadD
MSQSTGTKRTRTEQPDNTQEHAQATGHDELMIACPEMQTRLGQKYCDEAGLLPLLLAHGIVRRVRTISVTVQPLGGDSFKVKLNAAAPSVGEAKAEIARTQGTSEARQELYKVAVRADGRAVREDDAEPEALNDDAAELEGGQMVAMAVKELPLVWRTCDEDVVTISEGGAVATCY